MKYNNFKKGAVGGMLALALMTTAVSVPRAEAATLQDFQAQIQTLLVQLQALKSKMPGSSNLGSCNPFAIDMTLGRSGVEVTNLQNFLIGRGHTIPAGATGYFGEQTRSALVKFQSQNGISPAVGYFGPQTRGKVNALCAATPKPTRDQGSTSALRGGEADIKNFQVISGDDTTLQEGQKNVAVMDIKFDVEDGDVQVSRVDLGFTSGNGNNEQDPWDVFSEISLWNDDERIARVDTSEEDNWEEDVPVNGDYRLRFTGLKWIVREDDTANLTVKVTTLGNINGTNDGEVWDIFVPDNGIRATDSEKSTIYTGDGNEIVVIDIDESGSEDELVVKHSDADPDATTLQLKDDTRSGFIKVFAFDLDTDDSTQDIEIRKLPIELTVSSGTVNTFIRDARIKVDGKTYTKKTITDGSTNTMLFEFNRGEFVIDGGDRVTVEVEVEFKALGDANEGTTIYGEVDLSGIVAKGSENLDSNQVSGSAIGETHVMRTKGIIGAVDGKSASVTSVDGSNNDYATYSIEVEVTAFGQDVYIPTDVAIAITYQLENGSGGAIGDTGTAVLSSSAREQGNYFRISEGDTETITLDVTYKPGGGSTTVRLQLLTIEFAGSTTAPNQSWSAVPANDYETATRTIVD